MVIAVRFIKKKKKAAENLIFFYAYFADTELLFLYFETDTVL